MFTIYSSDAYQQPANCVYPHAVRITGAGSLRKAVSRDYVCAKYRNSYRGNRNFEVSDCLPVEVDNDHSENPADWKTPEDIRRALPDVAFAVHYSRHDGISKNGKAPRPKYHVFFPIEPETDYRTYADMKKLLNGIFPFFDANAMDAARFFYGTKDPRVGFFPGRLTLTEYLYGDEFDRDLCGGYEKDAEIPQGSRNTTMFRWAVRSMKRYGNTEESRKAFLVHAERCVPPLPADELARIWHSAEKYYLRIAGQPGYVRPEEYNHPENAGWPEPIPFSEFRTDPFPVDALPEAVADYAAAVAESTQTSVGMAGAAAISVLSACLQKKYRVRGKPDWTEPLNTYMIVIAAPSERKSPVLQMMLRPVNEYESRYNRDNAAAFEAGRMRRRVLTRRQKAVEEQIAKGKAEPEELEQIAGEIAAFREPRPLQLYVDDITTEKLVSVIAENGGHAALISGEGGIFDTLSGIYTKNVNIDVFLKGYSGDTIRVDRIGRESESIMNPALTILLMAQPDVVSAVLGNPVFRGRGLTARFLYSIPESAVGRRKYRSRPVTEELYAAYERMIVNLLEDEYTEKPGILTLSPEADRLLEEFAGALEPRLTGDLSGIADWAGKLTGTVLRLSGLLCRAGIFLDHGFLSVNNPLTVSGKNMSDAIRLGKYFLNHAMAAHAVLPGNGMFRSAGKVLDRIREHGLTEFDRREAMRLCREFRTAGSIQPVLDLLEDYGYIMQKPQNYSGTGRPPLPKYAVNPAVHGH